MVTIKKLKTETNSKTNDTITRTIRISGNTFDKITELAEKNNLSFNSVINQIIEYGLKTLYFSIWQKVYFLKRIFIILYSI